VRKQAKKAEWGYPTSGNLTVVQNIASTRANWNCAQHTKQAQKL